jgi:NAD/NADP transhydrogenase alpha subunit
MYVNIAVLTETMPHERRFAMVPSVAARLQKLGGRLHMQPGAAALLNLTDADFPDVMFTDDVADMVADADVVLGVQAPSKKIIGAMKASAILICYLDEHQQSDLLSLLVAQKITCFAMQKIPRISRAQAMDALSSQAALAGYLSVMLGATYLKRILPKITTAGGAIGPAKVLVMGLGVAGLEAVAIPGKASPKLISKDQVAGMKAGSVIIDLSAEGGGNCAASVPGETVRVGMVTIAAPLNVPSLLSEDASTLYAKNLYNLLVLMLKDNVITIDWTDDVLAQTALTHDGKIMHAPAKAA